MSNFNFDYWKKNLVDLFFPELCLVCGGSGDWLCQRCRRLLKIQPVEICPVCKRDLASPGCLGSPLAHLWVLSQYHDQPIECLIKHLKYDYLTTTVSGIWSSYLDIFWSKFGDVVSRQTILVPVPLHRKKLLERGFNQSTLIALELGKITGLKVVEELLTRRIYTEPQVGLSGEKRIKNVKGIFKINYRALSDYWGKEIILIDDVYTTGSTMGEGARVLKAAGFTKVSALALAVS